MYWINPLSYTTYGLIASQLGDVTTPIQLASGGTQPINEYIQNSFGFEHDFIGWAAFIIIGFGITFRLVAAIGLKFLNFQAR